MLQDLFIRAVTGDRRHNFLPDFFLFPANYLPALSVHSVDSMQAFLLFSIRPCPRPDVTISHEEVFRMNVQSSMRYVTIPLVLYVFMMVAFTGCTDSTTSPSMPDNGNNFGVNATVVVSEEIPASEASDVRANVKENAGDTIVVQSKEVMEIILRLFADAEVLGLNLDYDSEELNYECVVRSGGRVYVVVIDPKTGDVKEQKEVEEYSYTGTLIINVNVVEVREVCERAREMVDGDVVEANLEQVEGEPTYIIIILTRENRYVTIYIDATTGKEKKLKDKEPCEKDDNQSDSTQSDSTRSDSTNAGDCSCVHHHHGKHKHDHKHRHGHGHYRHGKGKGYGHYYHHHCDCDCDDGGDDGGQNSDSLQVITKDSARVILGGMFGDSAAIGELELEVEDSTAAYYQTVVERGDERYEITLDAKTGGFVLVTQTRGDFENGEYEPPTVEGTSLVMLSVARAAALAELEGTIQSWTLERNKTDGRWVYTFTVEESASATIKRVRVDAETGLFIEIVA